MNEYAKTGVDPEFHKGETAIDRYYSDPSVKPNSCLGPIIKPPFYAVKMDAGEIGTKGGLVTDAQARVLREDGSVIERSEEHTSELQSLMRISYAVFCLKQKKNSKKNIE